MIEILTSNDHEKWCEIVEKFDNYDVYYSLDYVKAFKLHGDGEPILIHYHDEEIMAINVAMKRDIALDDRFSKSLTTNKYFDLVTPYGYGGFLIEGNITNENIQRLITEYENKCQQDNIVSEFVRFHPILQNHVHVANIYNVSELGKTITINLESPEQIWTDFHGKNRNVIRKAIKSGVEIYWGRSPELFDKFIKMYDQTMDRDSARDYYYFNKDFYNSILNDLKYNAMIFYAMYENEIISMSIILYSNNQLHYHLSASNREFQRLAPTNLLLYEVAKWGFENGYNTFHLGGGLGASEDNLYKFKKAFNRYEDTNFFIGKKIFNKKIYNDLISLRKESDFEQNNDFFPKYRG